MSDRLHHSLNGSCALRKLFVYSVVKLNGIIYAYPDEHGKGGHGYHSEGYVQEAHGSEEYLGDVMGQINSRRGMIQGMEIRPGNAQAIRALVPLAEMFGYATQLRSATQGRGV